jgi:uncharacterized protein (DUF927 family)
MSIALAFVGPLGSLIGGSPPMIQLVGPAESGKTSIAIAAGSVWGIYNDKRRQTFAESWNTTVNRLEPVAAAHNATFLVLDETGLVESRDNKPYHTIRKAAMRLHQGVEKARHGQDSSRRWWVPVLSTSNKSLNEMAADAHASCPAAVRTRLIDVPTSILGYGAYETLHGMKDEQAFSANLREVASNNYGRASRIFIGQLAAWYNRDSDGLKAFLSERRSRYVLRAKEVVGEGKHKIDRISESFAAIFAAGCAAIELDIIPWSRRVFGEALIACEQAHVGEVEVSQKLTEMDSRTEGGPKETWIRLRKYVKDNRQYFVDLRKGLVDRPVPLAPSSDPIGTDDVDEMFPDATEGLTETRVFVSQPKKPRSGPLEYLFTEHQIESMCGFDLNWFHLKPKLKEEGALIPGKERDVIKRQIYKPREDDDGRRYVIAIKAKAFA